MSLKRCFLVSGILGFSLLVACSKKASSSSSSESTSSLQLESVSSSSVSSVSSSDATAGNLQIMAANEVLPADVTDIVLGVSAIDIHTQNGSYVNVSSSAMTLDLATLTSSVSSLVQATVVAGNYDSVRLTFSSIAVTYANGDSMSYDFSSSSSNTDNEFVANLTPVLALADDSVTHLLLDVGAVAKAHSRGCGASRSPSAHSALLPPFQVIQLDTTGSVGGAVTTNATDSSGTETSSIVAGAMVTASLNGQAVASAQTDSLGNYYIVGLAAGTYTIYVSDQGYTTAEVDSVVVAVAATTNEDAVLVAASSSSNSSNNSNQGHHPPNPPWMGGDQFDHP